jgi:protein associated with RNAse G/E
MYLQSGETVHKCACISSGDRTRWLIQESDTKRQMLSGAKCWVIIGHYYYQRVNMVRSPGIDYLSNYRNHHSEAAVGHPVDQVHQNM